LHLKPKRQFFQSGGINDYWMNSRFKITTCRSQRLEFFLFGIFDSYIRLIFN
jgi:hypothetical protein